MTSVSSVARTLLFLTSLVLVTACDFVVSDEERLSRADEHMAAGAYRSAMIELKNVLVNDPDNLQARLRLAEVALGLGDLPTAETELARAIELGGAEAAIGSLHFEILMAKGEYVEILAALGIETYGLSATQLLDFRGRALLGTREFDAARAVYEEWLAMDPQASQAQIGLARAHAGLGDSATAILVVERRLVDDSSDVDAWLTLGILRFRSGDYTNAISDLTAALERDSTERNIRRKVEILSALAEAQLLTGDLNDARRNIARLTGLVPQSPAVMLLAARLAQIEQDYALAARHLQTLLTIHPDFTRAQLFLADMQMRQGYPGQAENLLERVISRAPDNLYARQMLARIQLRKAQPEVAMDLLAPLLESDSENSEVLSLAAEIYVEKGDVEAALVNLQAASALAPNDISVQLHLASGYLLAGRAQDAVNVLEDLPHGADGNYAREQLLILALRRLDRSDEADSIARNVVLRNESDPAAHAFIGAYSLAKGDAELSRRILTDALTRFPNAVDVLLTLAMLELQSGDPIRARMHFESVLAVDDNNLAGLMGLARSASAVGDFQQSVSQLEEAARHHPAAVEPRVYLAVHYIADSRADAALPLAREAIRLGVRQPRFNAMLGDVFRAAGMLEEALGQYRIAADRMPDNVAVQMSLAKAHLALDQSEEARQALERVLAMDSENLPARAALALVEMRLGDLEASDRSIEMLNRAQPENPAGMILRGEWLFERGNFVAAAESFRAAVERGGGRRAVIREHQSLAAAGVVDPAAPLQEWLDANPDDLAMRRSLGEYYQLNNSGERAIREYEAILDRDPGNADVLNNLAWQYQQDGDLERAAELAEQAWTANSESGSIADTLAWIYFELGRFDESLRLLRRAVALSPENGEIQYHLAAVLVKTGNTREAEIILRELSEWNRDFPSRGNAQQLLQQL